MSFVFDCQIAIEP